MEKKTVGKFISALRKANGMTQKELGEKLFVSDKTVSRWECDECTPELSLLPLIAEIFGITTDELLRGERNNPDREADSPEENANRYKAKSEKQFKLMLDLKRRKYKNLTLISLGITIFGFIAAVMANLGFSAGLFAFCFAGVFCGVSEICQLAFLINVRIAPDEENASYSERVQALNTSAVNTAAAISFANLSLISFCLPLVTVIDGARGGLEFLPWLGYGLLFALITFFISYIIYALFVRRSLVRKGRIVVSENHRDEMARNEKLLLKTTLTALAISLALGMCIGAWYIVGDDPFLTVQTFDDCDDFKTAMETDYDNWFWDTYGRVMINGEVLEMSPSDPNYPHEVQGHRKTYGAILNLNGEEICTYCYNPDLYWQIEFTASADDKMPVKVITVDSVYNARTIFQTVESVLYALILVNFLVAACVYVRKTKKIKKT